MKMISSTSITSMNGVTLISWVSAKSPSSSNSLPAIETAIALLRRRTRHRAAADMGAVEIARQQPRRHARGAVDELKVTLRHPREVIVDDDRGDGGDKADGGGEQRLGDAGRHHSQIGGLRLRDADKGIHDAPHGAEQADKGRGRADGGEQAHAQSDAASFSAHDLGAARSRALLDAGVAGDAGR